MVGVTKIGHNYDILHGVGGFFRICGYFGAFVEVDAVARVGELNTLNGRFEIGIATHQPAAFALSAKIGEDFAKVKKIKCEKVKRFLSSNSYICWL